MNRKYPLTDLEVELMINDEVSPYDINDFLYDNREFRDTRGMLPTEVLKYSDRFYEANRTLAEVIRDVEDEIMFSGNVPYGFFVDNCIVPLSKRDRPVRLIGVGIGELSQEYIMAHTYSLDDLVEAIYHYIHLMLPVHEGEDAHRVYGFRLVQWVVKLKELCEAK